MENTFNSRLRQLLKHFKMTQKDLAERISVTTVTISRWMKDDEPELTFPKLVSILKVFPGVDATWLILGEGEMLKEESKYSIPLIKEDPIRYGKEMLADIDDYKKRIKELERYIDFAIQEAEANREMAKQAMNMLSKKS